MCAAELDIALQLEELEKFASEPRFSLAEGGAR
jgi:hypothetical protein